MNIRAFVVWSSYRLVFNQYNTLEVYNDITYITPAPILVWFMFYHVLSIVYAAII